MKRNISKKNKHDAGKVGTIFLVAIVALAGAGVAYSMWTQELQIIGTISSGEVKIGLYDYKTLDPGPSISQGGVLYPLIEDPAGENPETYGTADPNHAPGVNSDGKNIASHESINDGTEITFTKTIEGEDYIFTNHVTEIVDGVYPWYASGTTVYVGNGGTIPVRITDVSFERISGNMDLLNYLVIEGWEIKEYNSNTQSGWTQIGTGTTIDDLVAILDCFQLDPCHTLSIEISFYFLEEFETIIMPQGETLTFEIDISAAQWNEVPCGYVPPDTCKPLLTIEKTVSYDEGQPYMGSQIEYTIVVTNNGDCEAENVVVNDLLPDGVTYVSHLESQGTYIYTSGVWTVGSLGSGNTATLTIQAEITNTGATATAPTQLAMVVDGSNSIDDTEWSLMVNGIANAIEDPTVFPHDGSIELSVIQFGGTTARVEVDTVIITDLTTAQVVGTTIRGILKNLGSTTPLAEGLTLAADTLKASVDYSSYPRKVINIVTDGNPTYPSPSIIAETEAIAARNYLLSELGMSTVDDGEIDAEAIGDDADTEWLRTNIVWPGNYLWSPPTPPIGPGWVRYVENFEGFEEAIKEKFATILTGIENCATLDADNFDQIESCITINPLPAQTSG